METAVLKASKTKSQVIDVNFLGEIDKSVLEIVDVKYSEKIGSFPSSVTIGVEVDGQRYFQKYFADKRAQGVRLTEES